MRTIDINTFINSFEFKPNKSMSFLLGASAFVSSNILSNGVKRSLYCTV